MSVASNCAEGARAAAKLNDQHPGVINGDTADNGSAMHKPPTSAADAGSGTAAADHVQKPFGLRVMHLVEQLELLASSKSAEQLEQLPPVVDFRQPTELVGLLPQLGEPADSDDELLLLCRRLAELSVRTGDFRFRNQLFGGVDPYGMGGALITECLNTSQYTYEVAPVFTLCEAAVLQRTRRLVGWSDGDGIMTAGGSMANQYALALARFRRHPDVKRRGLFGMRPLVVFTSQDAHYSILKAAHWHGYGIDNVVTVATDERGRMRPEALEQAVLSVQADGREPLVVNATAGTTVLGAYDPLPQIAELCERYGLWLHVDACWGGAALLSARYRSLLEGVERADSLAWNPHKMLGAPLQCSLFVTRHCGLLHRCNSAAATYLFQQDKFYDVSFDTGDKSVQCGRKVDAFKVWLMWKAHGDAGLNRMVDATFAAAHYCGEQVALRPGFRPVLQTGVQCANVCFWYVPESLRGQEETADWWRRLALVAPLIKEAMVRAGTLMVGYQPQPHKALVNFFRLVFTAVPEPQPRQVDHVLDEIAKLGEEISL